MGRAQRAELSRQPALHGVAHDLPCRSQQREGNPEPNELGHEGQGSEQRKHHAQRPCPGLSVNRRDLMPGLRVA